MLVIHLFASRYKTKRCSLSDFREYRGSRSEKTLLAASVTAEISTAMVISAGRKDSAATTETRPPDTSKGTKNREVMSPLYAWLGILTNLAVRESVT
jgi:hypothetical protein